MKNRGLWFFYKRCRSYAPLKSFCSLFSTNGVGATPLKTSQNRFYTEGVCSEIFFTHNVFPKDL